MYQNLGRNCEVVLKQNLLPLYFRRFQSVVSRPNVSPVGPMELCVTRSIATANIALANNNIRLSTKSSASHSAIGLGLLRRSVAVMPTVRSSSCTCTMSNEASRLASKIDQLGLVHLQGQITQTYGYTLFGRNALHRNLRDLPWGDSRPSGNIRNFHAGFVNCSAKPEGSENDRVQVHDKADDNSTKGTATENGTSAANMRVIAPSNFDKKILVWTGKYPSIEAVPSLVSDSTLNWAKNKFRVYVNIAMAVATFCTALVVMVIGRRRAERGESVSKMNMMRHPQQYQQQLQVDKETSLRSK